MDAAPAREIAELTAARQFQRELRRWRTRKGLTQRALADRVRFSRETVAAVEAGRRFGSQELAIRCDQVLGTGGRLAELWPRVAEEQAAADGRRGPRVAGSERAEPAGVDPLPEDRDRRAVVEAIDELRGLIDQMLRVHLPSDVERSSVELALARAGLATPGAATPGVRAELRDPGVDRADRSGEPAAEPAVDRRRLTGEGRGRASEPRRGRAGAARWRG
ncbi:helix-turn-helix transcriptional regulator [Plantactinospora sp. B5E13]|uniref:helix-turn-helix transcriptional regulator n=1 Tax=unclassified Plantactinospora TaxID=2631981 RepID=UPI00325E29E4